MKPKLDTDAAIRGRLKPGRHAVARGLYLNVTPAATATTGKSWVLRVMARGRRIEMGLGSYPDVSLKQATTEAAEYRQIARRGGDPVVARDAKYATHDVPTFEKAATTVHEGREGTWRNPKHRQQWINTLKVYAFPTIGKRLVSEIQSPDILNALAPIWLTKPETARRVRQRISLVLDWAKAHGYRTGDNPVAAARAGAGLPKQPEIPEDEQHYTALPYGDVPGFVQAMRDANASASIALAFEFLILTAGRTEEVLGAKWSEVDMDAAMWVIPGTRMKAKRRHRVPLGKRAVAILKQAQALRKRGDYLFPGPTAERLSNMAFLMVIRRMEVNTTAHGMRASFRTWASEQTNVPNQICEWALAHGINDKTQAAYDRTDNVDRRRKLMQQWESFVTGEAKVVKLKRAG